MSYNIIQSRDGHALLGEVGGGALQREHDVRRRGEREGHVERADAQPQVRARRRRAAADAVRVGGGVRRAAVGGRRVLEPEPRLSRWNAMRWRMEWNGLSVAGRVLDPEPVSSRAAVSASISSHDVTLHDMTRDDAP